MVRSILSWMASRQIGGLSVRETTKLNVFIVGHGMNCVRIVEYDQDGQSDFLLVLSNGYVFDARKRRFSVILGYFIKKARLVGTSNILWKLQRPISLFSLFCTFRTGTGAVLEIS